MKTSIAALAALAIVGGAGFAFASSRSAEAPTEWVIFTDAHGNTYGAFREVYQVERVGLSAAELPASPPADVPPVAPVEAETERGTAPEAASPAVTNPQPRADDDCVIPSKAISSSDGIENFSPANGRFSKVPRYLAPFYERACRDYKVPVRYLVADGSYESHFRVKAFGDGGTSCGIHMFRDVKKRWTGWFAGGIGDCQDAEKNIRKAAEHWRNLMDGGRTLAQAIKKHNGAGPRAERYMRTVMGGADRYYAN